MKITNAFLVALAGAKKPRSWGEEINGDACIYDEMDGVTTVTTVERLTEQTKCFKKFSCDGGRNVMVKVNSMSLGSFHTGHQFCSSNFIKFAYSIPREGDSPFLVETQSCGGKFSTLDQGLESGDWKTLEEHVWFSFEFAEFDYYDWFYVYNEYEGFNDYGEYNFQEYKAKFEVEFKCSEPVETTGLPTTTLLAIEPTTTPPPTTVFTTTVFIGNQAYNRLNGIRNSWKLMVDKSTMKSNAKTRIENKLNRLTDKFKSKHDKITVAGCTFYAMNEMYFGISDIDFTDTCRTSYQLLFELEVWSEDFILVCNYEDGVTKPKNIFKFWTRMTSRLTKFRANIHRFAKCD